MIRDKKVLVIGSGGREHAIVDAFSRSAHVEKIYCAPGNAGIAEQAECVPIKVEDVKALADFAEANGIDLTFVGPEAALAAGVADEFERRGLTIFGPSKAATRIESSKEFAKQLMLKHGIPTAAYRSFSEYAEAADYIKTRPTPIVVKFDGLAAGKGVVVAQTREEADEALRDMLDKRVFGAGEVIIEDFLAGPEFSLMCLVNGEDVIPLSPAQDHKRAYDGDKGPNTGGMGAYSPVGFVTPEVFDRAMNEIMIPAAKAMVAEGCPFTGVLYGGLILTADGPKVIEFNARFGDPETEVILPRLQSDFYQLIDDTLNVGTRHGASALQWNPDVCLGIVLAAKGYPGKYEKGIPLTLPEIPGVRYFHMGTAMKDGQLVSAGGRVLMATAFGPDKDAARALALEAAEKIAAASGERLFFRHDIGNKLP